MLREKDKHQADEDRVNVYLKVNYVDIRAQNVEILQEAGGKGCLYWIIRIHRRKTQNCLMPESRFTGENDRQEGP